MDPNKAVIIRLKNEHDSRVVVGVDDPAATMILSARHWLGGSDEFDSCGKRGRLRSSPSGGL